MRQQSDNKSLNPEQSTSRIKPKYIMAFIALIILLAFFRLVTPPPTSPTQTTIPTEVAMNDGLTIVTRNEDWTPIERDFDGVPMVLVPVGCFTMGRDDGEEENERPAHLQCFEQPFWIDKYEVSQAQFRQFNGLKAYNNYFEGDNLPIEFVTWFEARDFCLLRAGRLPTEREWEYASRGPNNLLYPWGNEFVAEYVIYYHTSNNQTALIGSRTDNVSWVGAMDMSGNVWEWVSSIPMDYPYLPRIEEITDGMVERVHRGGSWQYFPPFLDNVYRFKDSPIYADAAGGVRCARDYVP